MAKHRPIGHTLGRTHTKHIPTHTHTARCARHDVPLKFGPARRAQNGGPWRACNNIISVNATLQAPVWTVVGGAPRDRFDIFVVALF